jgi:hypothetical protein
VYIGNGKRLRDNWKRTPPPAWFRAVAKVLNYLQMSSGTDLTRNLNWRWEIPDDPTAGGITVDRAWAVDYDESDATKVLITEGNVYVNGVSKSVVDDDTGSAIVWTDGQHQKGPFNDTSSVGYIWIQYTVSSDEVRLKWSETAAPAADTDNVKTIILAKVTAVQFVVGVITQKADGDIRLYT